MLDKDTEKSVFAPRKKKEKKIRRLFNLYSVSLLRAHARARLHRGNTRRHERKKKERFCVQSFGGRKKEERAETEKTTTTVRGGFLEKNARVFVTARSTSKAPLHAAFSGKKKKREKGARRYFKSIERKHESFFVVFFVFFFLFIL